MSTVVAVTQFACSTSSGSQSITTSDLGGLTPSTALIFMAKATTNGSLADEAEINVNVIDDDGDAWTLSSWSEHDVGRTDTYASSNAGRAAEFYEGGNLPYATFTGYITNGIQINWVNPPAAAYLGTVVFFAGTDVSSELLSQNVSDGGSPYTQETDFESSFILCFAPVSMEYGQNQSEDDWSLHFGFCINDGSATQAFVRWFENDNTSDGGMNIRGQPSTYLGGHTTGYVYAHNFQSTSHQVSTSDGSGDYGELPMKIGSSLSADITIVDTPTSIGTQSITSLGYKPQLVLIVGTYADSNFGSSDILLGAGSVGAADANGNESCVNWQSEYGAATTNTSCGADSKIINMPQDDGTTGIVATLSSLDTSGFTLNYSSVDTGTSRKLLVFTIEEEGEPPAGGTHPWFYRRTQ